MKIDSRLEIPPALGIFFKLNLSYFLFDGDSEISKNFMLKIINALNLKINTVCQYNVVNERNVQISKHGFYTQNIHSFDHC